MSESVNVQGFSSEDSSDEHLFDEELLDLPKDVILYEINGPLFFGAARQFQETITNTQLQPKVIIIRMRYVPLIDATGYQSIKEIIKTYKSKHIKVIISGIRKPLRKDFEKNEVFSFIDSDFVVEDIHNAIKIAKENL
jgi:SulP family sulfate permease